MISSIPHALALPDFVIVPPEALHNLRALVECTLDAVNRGDFPAPFDEVDMDVDTFLGGFIIAHGGSLAGFVRR